MKGEDQKMGTTVREAESVERGKARTVVAALDESSFADDVFDFLCRNFNSEDTKVVFTYVARPVDCECSNHYSRVEYRTVHCKIGQAIQVSMLRAQGRYTASLREGKIQQCYVMQYW